MFVCDPKAYSGKISLALNRQGCVVVVVASCVGFFLCSTLHAIACNIMTMECCGWIRERFSLAVPQITYQSLEFVGLIESVT